VANTTVYENRTIEISYNSGSDSYTLTSPERSVNFTGVDVIPDESSPGRTTFHRELSDTEAERLLLLTTTIDGKDNQSVGIGVWQSSRFEGNKQQSDIDVFTFGFETPFSEIPRSGTVTYSTDLYALITLPDAEPRDLISDGPGELTLDLTRGAFAAHNVLREFGLRPEGGGSVGALYFDAAGYLSSDANRFDGTFFYNGDVSRTFGELTGQFFGPGAHEVGAVFSGIGRNGVTLNGALTGQLDASSDSALALAEQPLPYTPVVYGTVFNFTESLSRPDDFSSGPSGGGANMRFETDGIFFSGPSSEFPQVNLGYTDADTSSNLGYRTWTQNVDEYDIEVKLNDPENGGVALTYLNFGSAKYFTQNSFFTWRDTLYFRYGVPTTRGVLMARNGTATYSGVLIGEAANSDSGSQYSVEGTSAFIVDFTNDTVGGSLTMEGTRPGEADAIAFGTWAIDGQLAQNFGHLENLVLRHETSPAGTEDGYMEADFYGPNGEEIGAQFEAILPSGVLGEYLNIGGVTVATQD
jgi:hypothetical protein